MNTNHPQKKDKLKIASKSNKGNQINTFERPPTTWINISNEEFPKGISDQNILKILEYRVNSDDHCNDVTAIEQKIITVTEVSTSVAQTDYLIDSHKYSNDTIKPYFLVYFELDKKPITGPAESEEELSQENQRISLSHESNFSSESVSNIDACTSITPSSSTNINEHIKSVPFVIASRKSPRINKTPIVSPIVTQDISKTVKSLSQPREQAKTGESSTLNEIACQESALKQPASDAVILKQLNEVLIDPKSSARSCILIQRSDAPEIADFERVKIICTKTSAGSCIEFRRGIDITTVNNLNKSNQFPSLPEFTDKAAKTEEDQQNLIINDKTSSIKLDQKEIFIGKTEYTEAILEPPNTKELIRVGSEKASKKNSEESVIYVPVSVNKLLGEKISKASKVFAEDLVDTPRKKGVEEPATRAFTDTYKTELIDSAGELNTKSNEVIVGTPKKENSLGQEIPKVPKAESWFKAIKEPAEQSETVLSITKSIEEKNEASENKVEGKNENKEENVSIKLLDTGNLNKIRSSKIQTFISGVDPNKQEIVSERKQKVSETEIKELHILSKNNSEEAHIVKTKSESQTFHREKNFDSQRLNNTFEQIRHKKIKIDTVTITNTKENIRATTLALEKLVNRVLLEEENKKRQMSDNMEDGNFKLNPPAVQLCGKRTVGCDGQEIKILCRKDGVSFKLKCRQIAGSLLDNGEIGNEVRYECEIIKDSNSRCIDKKILESCDLKCCLLSASRESMHGYSPYEINNEMNPTPTLNTNNNAVVKLIINEKCDSSKKEEKPEERQIFACRSKSKNLKITEPGAPENVSCDSHSCGSCKNARRAKDALCGGHCEEDGPHEKALATIKVAAGQFVDKARDSATDVCALNRLRHSAEDMVCEMSKKMSSDSKSEKSLLNKITECAKNLFASNSKDSPCSKPRKTSYNTEDIKVASVKNIYHTVMDTSNSNCKKPIVQLSNPNDTNFTIGSDDDRSLSQKSLNENLDVTPQIFEHNIETGLEIQDVSDDRLEGFKKTTARIVETAGNTTEVIKETYQNAITTTKNLSAQLVDKDLYRKKVDNLKQNLSQISILKNIVEPKPIKKEPKLDTQSIMSKISSTFPLLKEKTKSKSSLYDKPISSTHDIAANANKTPENPGMLSSLKEKIYSFFGTTDNK